MFIVADHASLGSGFLKQHKEVAIKIGVFDIETSSLYANTGIELCCCVKRYGTDKIQTIRADEFSSWKNNRSNNRDVIVATVDILKEYDVLVAHNGQYFDKTFLNSMCLKYEISPSIRWLKFIDPVLLARRHMRIARNSLVSLIDYFDLRETKSPVAFKHWIQASHDGNKKSMGYIVEHCKKDVKTLEQVYDRVRLLVDKIDNKGSAY